MERHKRIILMMAIDAILVNVGLFTALLIRFDAAIPIKYVQAFKEVALLYTLISLVCFYIFGLYKKLWQYASVREMLVIVGSVSVAAVIRISYTYFIISSYSLPLPRSVLLLTWLLNIMLIGGSRLSWRIFRDFAWKPRMGGIPVLIVGAGDAGAIVGRELKYHYSQQYKPVGYVDDDYLKQHHHLNDLPVLGTRADIPALVQKYSVKEIIIAIPSAAGKDIRPIVEICRQTSAKIKILPGVYELIEGKAAVKQLREVSVEDLLGREPVKVDLSEIVGYLKQETVLVTGAGGSIGSELCRQISGFNPKRLVLLGHGENSIFEIEMELRSKFPGLKLETVIADIKDRYRIQQVFELYKPQVVFHAAAHKHVPLMEANPGEAIKNNVLGTRNVAEAADRARAKIFVLISSDKAVNPTSVMGATKRMAEMIIQTMDGFSDTRYVAVRFGNVLGSRGSVIPVFKKQIAGGGPVTVTHPEMTRYFMTIPEAVQLVIQAGAIAKGGEIFVLDMGESVKILDLANDLIRLSGFEPGIDIAIAYSGIRPGEKLYEELLTSEEGTTATKHKRIFVAKPNGINQMALEQMLKTVSQRNFDHTNQDVEELIRQVVPTFREKLRMQVG